MPNWLQEIAKINDPARYLFAFRTLLIPDAMFGVPVLDPAHGTDQGHGYSFDLIVTDTDTNTDGLPVMPELHSLRWPRVTANLLAAAWFSHLQQVAELLESSMLNLDRGRLVVAAIQARTALEVSERAFVYIDEIASAADDGELSEIVKTFLIGDRTFSQKISYGIRAMHQRVSEANGWSEDAAGENLYSDLCDLTHPQSKLEGIYTSEHLGGFKLNPPTEPLWTDIEWVNAGRNILVGAVVAGEGLRLKWQSVADVRSRLLSRDITSVKSNIQLRADFAVDPLGHLGARNAQTYLPPSTMSAFRKPGQDHLGPGENRLAGMLKEFECSHLPLGHFQESGNSAVNGWTWLRVRILLELELSIAEHLNRGEVICAAALSRFALEHAVSIFEAGAADQDSKLNALRKWSQGSADSIEKVLFRSGASNPPDFGIARNINRTAGQIAKEGLNAFVHPHFDARKIYWKRFADGQRNTLLIPGQAKHLYVHSSDKNYDLDNPWSVSVAAIDIIEMEGVIALATASSQNLT